MKQKHEGVYTASEWQYKERKEDETKKTFGIQRIWWLTQHEDQENEEFIMIPKFLTWVKGVISQGNT